MPQNKLHIFSLPRFAPIDPLWDEIF